MILLYYRSSLPDVLGEKIPCAMCDKTFTRRSDLKRHILNIHEGIKPFRCDLCPVSFSQITNLRDHYRKQHNQELHKDSTEFRSVVPGKEQIFLNFLNCNDFYERGIWQQNQSC